MTHLGCDFFSLQMDTQIHKSHLYKVKEMRIWGANVISLQLRMDNARFFVVGCYIPPSDLETLPSNEPGRHAPRVRTHSWLAI
jgi:hypothetical protein